MRSDRISVAVNVPLRQVFDYSLPPGQAAPAPGCRVRVPFGNRVLVGVVWEPGDATSVADKQLKAVRECIDEKPILTEADRKLLAFAARYYHQPVGEVVFAALPPALRQGGDGLVHIDVITITGTGRDAISAALARRAPKQHELLSLLAKHDQPLTADDLKMHLPHWRRVANALTERQWITIEPQTVTSASEPSVNRDPAPALTGEQASAIEQIRASGDGYHCWLLDGVTGSGKTEVFIRLIEQQLAAGRQTLVLVPEIGLTPQLVSRLQRRLGGRVAVMHSELSDNQRSSAWIAAANADAGVVVGTRSAVFSSLPKLGLIIVDEEHDVSLKQHEGFRYHARDLAIWRAAESDIPIVLGSATPSLESLANVASGRFRQLRLRTRATGAVAPVIRVIDTNRYNLNEGFTQPVLDTMQAHLDDGNQVLVYLNRRGYAPTLICTDCGAIADCLNCDAHMTVHASRQQLQCHHCGARRALPSACEACGQAVKPLGEGTERVEQTLANLIPEYPLARIDSDTTAARGAMQKALASAKRGDTRILVGTQMLAKGHHLPDLTLVVILNADQGFFASDFRASERLAQTIVQVAGRAGRDQRPGEVLIQSAFPQHRWLKTLVDEGYHAFADTILEERRNTGWPPFSAIAVLHAASKYESAAIEFLSTAKATLKPFGIEAMGPAPASMLRRQGRYRYQLLLSAPTRHILQTQLVRLGMFLQQHKPPHHLRWSLDIDPQTGL